MERARTVLLALTSLLVGAACDVEVLSGQTVTLQNGDTFTGVNRADAVIVRQGGTLIVENANVAGRGTGVEPTDAVPLVVGSAIVSEGGSVQVRQGTVTGGAVLVIANDPNTPPNPPPSTRILVLPPALRATPFESMPSVVSIDGGSFASGGVFGVSAEVFAASPALLLTGSRLTIRGGEFRLGPATFELTSNVIRAALSTVTIQGGSFLGSVSLGGSNSRISGGTIPLLSLEPFDPLDGRPLSPPLPPGCTEIRGGSIAAVSIGSQNETLFIFGTNFNRPLGRVAIARTSFPPGPGTVPNPIPSVELTGVLASGAPLDLDVFAASQAVNVTLAAPGSTGCPPQ